MSADGQGDAGRLVRRARWPLRTYPAAYRAAGGWPRRSSPPSWRRFRPGGTGRSLLATDVRPLASLVLAFTVSRVAYGFAYGRPLVMVGSAAITLVITASLVAGCALAWLLRRRIHASPPISS